MQAAAPFRPLHAALLLVLAAAVAGVLWPGRRLRDDPGDILRALRAARGPTLPTAQHVGAASRTPPSRHGRDTLADVIDGAAEAYLANGFVSAAMASYAFGAQDGAASVEIAAEAYRFEQDAGARAQASAERPPRAVDVPGLPGAVSDGGVLLAVAGRELLKLTVVSPGAGGAKALAAVAAAWREEQGP